MVREGLQEITFRLVSRKYNSWFNDASVTDEVEGGHEEDQRVTSGSSASTPIVNGGRFMNGEATMKGVYEVIIDGNKYLDGNKSM